MKEVELKPCPFCGNDPDLEIEDVDLNGSATMDGFQYCCHDCGVYKGEFMSIEEAEIAWNERYDDEKIERLNKEIERLQFMIDNGLGPEDMVMDI